jgi:hypothetical protein
LRTAQPKECFNWQVIPTHVMKTEVSTSDVETRQFVPAVPTLAVDFAHLMSDSAPTIVAASHNDCSSPGDASLRKEASIAPTTANYTDLWTGFVAGIAALGVGLYAAGFLKRTST